jgi:hypothetical protein
VERVNQRNVEEKPHWPLIIFLGLNKTTAYVCLHLLTVVTKKYHSELNGTLTLKQDYKQLPSYIMTEISIVIQSAGK